MPIYEYRCRQCRRRSSVFVLSYKEKISPVCPHCGSTNLARIMSRFATVRSEESRLESLADPASMGNIDEQDPASVARWMKKMGKEFGDELGEDFESAVEEASESPESPDQDDGESAGGTGEG